MTIVFILFGLLSCDEAKTPPKEERSTISKTEPPANVEAKGKNEASKVVAQVASKQTRDQAAEAPPSKKPVAPVLDCAGADWARCFSKASGWTDAGEQGKRAETLGRVCEGSVKTSGNISSSDACALAAKHHMEGRGVKKTWQRHGDGQAWEVWETEEVVQERLQARAPRLLLYAGHVSQDGKQAVGRLLHEGVCDEISSGLF